MPVSQQQPGFEETPPHNIQTSDIELLGRYALIKKIATGGMAEIWLARQSGPAGYDRLLVLKRILARLNGEADFVDMFLDEARTTAAFNHPNVVQVYDFGQIDGRHFISMEFILGENLAALSWRAAKDRAPTPVEYTARIFADACKGLHHAHTLHGQDGRPLHIIHRDISPQNIMVTYEGQTKVVDFGIAKAANQSKQTQTDQLKGKFSYMSPEQCGGGHLDLRSDVFSLGIVLYEQLTTKRLFKHESELMILDMITRRDPLPPSQVNPDVPHALEAIVMKALEKAPERRFQSADEMGRALEAFLETSQNATQVDVAQYMHIRFRDRLRRKRAWVELVSKVDLSRRRLVVGGAVGRPEGQVTVRPVHPNTTNYRPLIPLARPVPRPLDPRVIIPPPHARGSPGMIPPPPGFYEAIASGRLVPHPVTGQPVVVIERERNTWSGRLIGACFFLILCISAFVAYYALSSALPVTSVQESIAPMVETGVLSVDSVPRGAHIYLDGVQLLKPDGSVATTPGELGPLKYGTPFEIRFLKEDHHPETVNIVMSKDSDGKVIKPVLRPLEGKLRIEVTTRQQAKIFIDDQLVDTASILTRSVPSGRSVQVSASYKAFECSASPASVTTAPSETKLVKIACKRPSKTRRVRAKKAPAPKTNVCKAQPDLPAGTVHIDSEPYAEMFFNGENRGQTPLANLRLPAGCIELEFRTVEGQRFKKRLTVKPGVVNTFRVTAH